MRDKTIKTSQSIQHDVDQTVDDIITVANTYEQVDTVTYLSWLKERISDELRHAQRINERNERMYPNG